MKNDNRDYLYVLNSFVSRVEYSFLSSLIKKGSSVIDLGCGDGSLLKIIKEEKDPKKLLGIDISTTGVALCAKKGIDAIVGRIDLELKNIKNKSFDYSICNVTIQMVLCPEILIKEMCRISETQIISFPNFGFILNRLEMLFMGRMPKFMLFGYDWYSTGHIHQLSVSDFEKFILENNIEVEKKRFILPWGIQLPSFLEKTGMQNFFSMLALYQLKGEKKKLKTKKKKFPKWPLVVLLIVFIIFLKTRLIPSLKPLNVVKNDLYNMLFLKRNYTYDQKMSELEGLYPQVEKIVRYTPVNSVVFVPINNAFMRHEMLAYFLYPRKVLSYKNPKEIEKYEFTDSANVYVVFFENELKENIKITKLEI